MYNNTLFCIGHRVLKNETKQILYAYSLITENVNWIQEFSDDLIVLVSNEFGMLVILNQNLVQVWDITDSPIQIVEFE